MLWLYTKVAALRATRDRGATAAEYALIIAFVAVIIAAIVGLFGQAIADRFTDACNEVAGTGTGVPAEDCAVPSSGG